MYHARDTIKEVLKQVVCFSKQSENYGKMCPRRQLSRAQLQNIRKFCSFCVHIMFLILVHKLKCETNLYSSIHLISHLPFAMAMFWRFFWELAPTFL